MKNKILVFLLIAFFACKKENKQRPEYVSEGKYSGEYFPTDEWRSCSAEEFGISLNVLEKVHSYVTRNEFNTNGLLIIKDGYIIYEEYFNNHSKNSLHPSYSIAKSFSSSAIGIAIDKGLIESVNDSIAKYFPQLQGSEIQKEKKEITIKHLLTMSAGIQWNEDDYYSENSPNDVFRMINEAQDYLDYVLSKPVINKPGTEYYYSSGESMLLSGIIENATGKTLFEFIGENLLSKTGADNLGWSSDPSGHTIGGWGIMATLRDYARFGYLYMNKGKWGEEQLISKSWVEESVNAETSGISYYGYQWWIGQGFQSFYENKIPQDAFMGIGIYRQYLVVIPSEKLIVVRTGYDIPSETPNWSIAELLSIILDN